MSPRGDALVAYGSPGMTEVTRMGEGYQLITTTAVAPVVALPTTTSQLTIWNGEASGTGKLYSIDSIFAVVVVTAAAATGLGMCALLNAGEKAAPTAGTLVARGLAGQVYAGMMVNALAQTVVDEGWMPWGNSVVGPASQVVLTFEAQINGRIVVPPKHLFHTAALANTASSITVRQGIRWHEIRVPVGA